MLEGRPEVAIKNLEPLVAQEDANPWLLQQLAWAYLRVDEEKHIQQAAGLAGRAVSWAQKRPGLLADALWVQGMVLIRQRRNQEAQGVLSEGLERACSMPYPYMEARILEQMGLLEKQRDQPELARARLEEALAIFRRLGAKKDVERLERMVGRS
jgi:tetratricopeptide (TPR) repeat protein